ncbi:hypothetical protein J3A83DRAFT_4409219 [Scleroderma citrinum]
MASALRLTNEVSLMEQLVRRKQFATVLSRGAPSPSLLQQTSPVHLNATCPTGWKKIHHPDVGSYYFYEEEGIYTWSHVPATRICTLIMKAAEQLRSSPELQEQPRQKGNILVLSVDGDRPNSCSYYLVSRHYQRIFWLEQDKPEERCASKFCKRTPQASMSHCILAQYWKHYELFPTALALDSDIINNTKDILIQASGERVTSKFSTSPYTKDDLAYMLNLVKEIEGILVCFSSPKWDVNDAAGDGNPRASGHSSWVIAKLMSLHVDGLLRSSYGQSDDYFDIDYSETTPIKPYRRTWLLYLLGPILLKSADTYAEELYTFLDNFSPESWSRFVQKVDTSVRDSNLLATVLLSTSTSVLAINSVDNSTNGGSRSAVQIAIYTSIILSVGSIAVGLAIFQQYRAKGVDTPLRAVAVLRCIFDETYGLERLAIACSLPHVLLIYSLAVFLCAFSIDFYLRTDSKVWIPVSITLVIVFLSLFTSIHPASSGDVRPATRTGPPREKASWLGATFFRRCVLSTHWKGF